MAYIVALTGGIGSGKTTIANAFAALGVPIVDADIISRQVVEAGSPALAAIAAHFGQDILLPDSTLNRPLLRHKICSSGVTSTTNTLSAKCEILFSINRGTTHSTYKASVFLSWRCVSCWIKG